MKILLALLMTTLAACGGTTSAVDVCKSGCDKTFSCSGGTTDEIASCKTECSSSDSLGASLASCTNGNAILSCVNGCYGISDCNKSTACVSGCPECITKSGPPGTDGGSTSGNDGSTSGNDGSTSGSDECSQFCAYEVTCAGQDMGISTADCLQACEQVKGAPCQSGGENLECLFGCGNSSSCSQFNSCVDACPSC